MTILWTSFRWVCVNGFALVFSIAISTGFFLILPILQYMNLHAPLAATKVHEVANLEQIMPQRKSKAKPPEQKQISQPQAKSTEAPKTMARSRFAMDLGVGGGSGGGGVAIAGGPGAGNEQQSYQEGETDADATPLRQVPPAYPEEARKAGISGTVRSLLTIDENGSVVNVQILESPGNYGFEASIREAVAKWRYKPAEVNGIPVRQKVEQPFQF